MLVGVLAFCSCQSNSRQLEKAKILYQQGLELSADNSYVAIEFYHQALLELDRCDQELLEARRLKGQIKDELGNCYWALGHCEQSLELHQEAIEIFRPLPGNVFLLNALQNAGRAAASLHQLEVAGAYYEEALEISKTQSSRKLSKEVMLELCHDVYLEKGEYEKVVELLTDALGNGAAADFSHLTLGLAYASLQDEKSAIEHLSQAAQSDKADIKTEAYLTLYRVYESKKDYAKALECIEKYNENLVQAQSFRHREEVEYIKRDHNLQMQKINQQAERKLKTANMYLIVGLLLLVVVAALLLLRQKSLKTRLKQETRQRQLELAFKKNKVYMTALALSEKIMGNTEEFVFEDSEWNDYLELVNVVYVDFTKKLLERYPTLTQSDLQICGLTRQGFNNQVISALMNLQNNSYARRKYRIKQDKMNGAQDERSFEEIVNEI